MPGAYALGVMQGRLLPKYKGRYQAHPKGYWRKEFDLARDLRLDVIEFILDFDDAFENPLMHEAGLAEIQAATDATGVGVKSICADYFMETPLHCTDAAAAEQSRRVLDRLIGTVARLGVRDIVVPCVDQSSLGDEDARRRLIQALRPLVPRAEGVGIHIALETDLAPKPFAALLDDIGSAAVTVNYDTGNSAALGHDPAEEFAAYGDRITDIHLKDRVRGGGSTELGTGDTDFDRVFSLIARSGFDGPLIMQAYRNDEGIAVFKRQAAWLTDRYGPLLRH